MLDPIPHAVATAAAGPTPYQILSAAQPVQRAAKRTLISLVRGLEREALADPPPAVAATLQDVRFLTPRTRDVYVALAAAGAPARLFARSLQAWLAPGVTGVALDDDDPLVDEWSVVLPHPHRPVVFSATDCHEAVDDLDRTFCWAVSRDPEVVGACAASLLGPGVGPPAGT